MENKDNKNIVIISKNENSPYFDNGEEFNEKNFENEKRISFLLKNELEKKIEEQKKNEEAIKFLRNKIIELKKTPSKDLSAIREIDYKLKNSEENSEEKIINELKDLKKELIIITKNSKNKENYTEMLFFFNSIILIILIAYLSNLFSKLINKDKEKS